MVFFICNYCGEAAKKAAVEKHYYTKCRGRIANVSCMDCLKDFSGEEYAAHTKCITELEKYSGKNYVAKTSMNSGAKKQEIWMEIVRSILESTEYVLKPQMRSAFQKLQTVENVPRKKAKFENFATNCVRLDKKLVADVWNVLEQELEKMKMTTQKPARENQEINGTQSNDQQLVIANKDGEDGHPNMTAGEYDTDANGAKEFDWATAIEKVLSKHPTDIPPEKLQRKVFKKYVKRLGTSSLSEKQLKKFEKRYAKNMEKYPGRSTVKNT